jgi:1-phosphatidylinositol-4-phosphate 5-kinase
VFKAKESAGKSGSFFFFSYDKKFLIKTMNNNELRVFKEALPDYV